VANRVGSCAGFATADAVDDDVADVDADAKVEPLVGSDTRVALGHAALHVDRAAHGIDHAREFQEQTVAGRLDDAAVMFGDLGVDELTPVGFQRCQRAAVVHAHEARVPDHIERDDCRQASVVPRHVPLHRVYYPAPSCWTGASRAMYHPFCRQVSECYGRTVIGQGALRRHLAESPRSLTQSKCRLPGRCGHRDPARCLAA